MQICGVELCWWPTLTIFEVGMGASEFLLKLGRVCVFEKTRDGLAFLYDLYLTDCVLFHELLGDVVCHLEETRRLDDINLMKLIFIVSLKEADRHFHRFQQTKRTNALHINNTHNILDLATNKHIPIQELKEILQGLIQLFLFHS